MSSIDRLVEKLEACRGDLQAQAAIAAEFRVLEQTEVDREALLRAMDAGGVLRSFDVGLITRVLGIWEQEAQQSLELLDTMPFSETVRTRRGEFRNLHDATRIGWRRHLARSAPKRLRSLSLRAAACFETADPADRVERIYHLLCGEPDLGA